MSKTVEMQEHIEAYQKLIAEGYTPEEALAELGAYLHPTTLARLTASLKRKGEK